MYLLPVLINLNIKKLYKIKITWPQSFEQYGHSLVVWLDLGGSLSEPEEAGQLLLIQWAWEQTAFPQVTRILISHERNHRGAG